MKKTITSLVLLLVVTATTWAQQYDFSAVSGTNTLYYKITDADAKEVAVVSELNYWDAGEAYTTYPIGELIIPETVTDNGVAYRVTSIEKLAFRNCVGLKGSLTIPNNVDTIGECAFIGCEGFSGSLTIPNSVESIGYAAFSQCSGFTGNLTIGESVESIGQSAFGQCSGFTGSLTIPNSVEIIGEYAFGQCSGFTGSLTIGNSLDSIGYAAFADIHGLTDFIVNEGNAKYANQDGILYNKNFTTLIQCPQGRTGSITIPNGVTIIRENAFASCWRLNGSLTIPNSVDSIGEFAFLGCGFIAIYNYATTPQVISESVFGYVNNKNLYVPVDKIADYQGAMIWQDFQEVRAIGGVYVGDKFSAVSGENTLFYKITDVDAKEVAIVPELEYWYNGETYTIQLTGKLIIPESVTYNDVDYSVTSIEECAFYGCSGLTGSLTIPNSVDSIGEDAFLGCDGLNSITIGNGVMNIEEAFFECEGLTEFTVNEGNAKYASQDGILYNKDLTTLIQCPQSKIGTLTIPSSVDSIREGAFMECSGLTEFIVDEANTNYTSPNGILYSEDLSTLIQCPRGKTGTLTIPNGVVNIGLGAFAYCSSISGSLTIPSSVKNIGLGAFGYCSSISGSLTIPNSVDSIGQYAFTGCDQLTTVILPKGLTKINSGSFSECTSLENITFPDNLTKIGGDDTFSDTKWFANQPDGVVYIGKCLYAYKGTMPENTTITVVDGTTQICGDAFENQTNLLAITLPESLNRISSNAFNGATALAEVTMLGSKAPFVSNNAGAFNNIAINAKVYVPAEGLGTGDKQYGTVGSFWQGLNIVDATSTGIAGASAISFTQAGNTLYFSEPTKVAIYNVSGTMLYNGTTTEYTLPSRIGVYIVCTDFGSYKVLSR